MFGKFMGFTKKLPQLVKKFMSPSVIERNQRRLSAIENKLIF